MNSYHQEELEMTNKEELVAVVGMAGRFPGAPDVRTFWDNLCAGRETLSVLSGQSDPEHPEYVPTYGVLDGTGDFDPGLFGLTPNDALVLDPQHRLLLECAYEALDRAGHGGDRPVTGVFVGASNTSYAEAVRARMHELPFLDEWQLRQATAPDFLATRIAYHLDLTGPALTVQTACSTSLVAVHVAVQAILNGECDMALAGGASVVPHLPPLRYTPGGIVAADGHCRAFDAASDGTVGASAVGLVVLRPLLDALADGDHVHAVIRGSAVNNDGHDKIGFTAPSVVGQAEVVVAAHLAAGITADQVGYVETHGTGTALGDPIEVTALTRAFRESTDGVGYCRIGSVKTNVGHADAAAGIVGLIKTVAAVEHGVLPASLHFTAPNPAIDFASSPFQVNEKTRPWEADGPRVAGVNALGVGGTNAHVVIEQAPNRPAPSAGQRQQLLVVSGKTPEAADGAARQLAEHLDTNPDTSLTDAAWTLQVGRTHHQHRRFVVASDTTSAVTALRASAASAKAKPVTVSEVVFLFAGQGGQHVGMARELYDEDAVFRRHLDEAVELATGPLGLDLREVLFPDTEAERAAAAAHLGTIAVAQPAVFVVQHALSQLLASWGLRPSAVAAHSLGAYAAACQAGVFTLRDAVRLVVERGRLLGTVPAGAMAAVKMPEEWITPRLWPGLSVGAVNGPSQCTVTGPAADVARLAETLTAEGIEARVLNIATAGHSSLVEPIMGAFGEFLAALPRFRSEVPLLSDTTGDWADPEQVRSVEYWVRHMREPVRFGAVLSTLFTAPGAALVDIGPGRALSTLVRQHSEYDSRQVVVHLSPHPAQEASESATLLQGLGQLWSHGAEPDFTKMHAEERRQRIELPSYAFQRKTYLVPPLTYVTREAAGPAIVPPGVAETVVGQEQLVSEHGRVLGAVVYAFGQALGIPDVDPSDSLFDLGGDSLTATKLASWAASRFQIPFTAADLLRCQSPREVAAMVEGQLVTS